MGISRLTAFCGIHGGQFLTLRIKSALALSERGNGGHDAGWARSRWRTALTTGTGACYAPVSGGERTDSPTEVGRHPDAFEVTLPRLFAFGFGCGGFVLREAFMADHRVELSGKFPANGFLRGWIVIEMIED